MPKWFYSKEGKDYGPLSAPKIANDVLANLLDIEDYVISDQNKVWVKVKDVPEIMDVIHKPSAHPIFDELAASEFSAFIKEGHSFEELERSRTLYYNIPANRLFFLQLVTLGLFEFYWFFRQWEYLRRKGRAQRGAIFLAIVIDWAIFIYICFRDIEMDRDMFTVKRAPWNPLTLAVWWYLGSALAAALAIYVDNVLMAVISGFVSLTVTSLILIPVQRYINEVNEIRKQKMPNILAS